MAEVITRISNANLPVELKKKYSEVQHIKETGRIAIYGIDKKSKKKQRIGSKPFVKSYGHNPTEKPEAVKGIWQGSSGERPVTVIGTYGRKKGEEHMRIKGRKAGVPRSEIKWLGDESDRAPDLAVRLEDMERKLNDLATRYEQLETRNRELEDINESLEARVEELQSELEAAQATDPPAQKSLRERIQTGWDRFTAPVYGGITRVATKSTIIREYDDEGNIVEERERRGPSATAAALGGAALGLALGYILWHKTGGHDVINNYYNKNHSPNGSFFGDMDNFIHPRPNGIAEGHSYNLELWNAKSGGNGVGIGLPDGYHLIPDANGHQDIINPNGNIALDNVHMNPSGAMSQASLDEAANHRLIKEGQTHIRYWDDTGPTLNPDMPSAKNPGWNGHTVTILGES